MKGLGKELVITDGITKKTSRSINTNFKKSSVVGQISSKAIVKSTKSIGKELVKTKSMSKIASASVDTDFKKIKQSAKNVKAPIKKLPKAILAIAGALGRLKATRTFRKLRISAKRTIKQFRQLKREAKSLGGSLKKTFGGLKGLVLGAGIVLGIKKAITVGADFQDSLADLSAITGATGKDLSLLTNETLRLAKASSTAQTEVASAIKIVASQKAELLKNIPALVGVTEQVLLLKNAAGIELADAAEIVTQSLNIFGAAADQTSRFVNVLAAGAKFGASEIADTGRAVVLSGAKARAAGIGFEDLNSIIQAVAKGGFKGAQAGTALSAIIGRLTRQGIDFRKSGIAGGFQMVKDAIDATIDPTKKALFIAKIFGEEHDKVGLSILNNIGLLDTMSKSITGTRVAQEQAQIRLGTFNSKMRKLGVIIKDRVIRVFNRLEPILTKLGTRFGEFIDSITPEQLNQFGDDLKIFVKDAVEVGKQIGSVLKEAFTGEGLGTLKEDLNAVVSLLGTIVDAGAVISSVFKGVGTGIGEAVAKVTTGNIFNQELDTSFKEAFSVRGKLFGVGESNVVNITERIKDVSRTNLPSGGVGLAQNVSLPPGFDLGKSLPEIRQGPTIGEGGDSKINLDINLKAPSGTVESIKRRDTGNVKKLNVGMNMEATG